MEPVFSLCQDHYPMNWDLPGEGYEDLQSVLSAHTSPIPAGPDLTHFHSPAYYPAYIPTTESSLPTQPPPSYETSLFKVHSANDVNSGEINIGSYSPGHYQMCPVPNPKTANIPRNPPKRRHSFTRTKPVFPESATPMPQVTNGKKLSSSSSSLNDCFNLDMVICEPNPLSPSNTPSSSPLSPIMSGSRNFSLEANMTAVYADQIWRVDQEILKLMSDRAELLLRAQQNDANHSCNSPHGMGKVPLFLSRCGVPTIDAVFSKANTLLSQICELRQEFSSTVDKLLYNSTQNGDLCASIQYIRGIIQPEQNLRISTQCGVYHLSIDSAQYPAESSKIHFYLDCVNAVLRAAQSITMKSLNIERVIGECQNHIQHSLETHDNWNSEIGLLDSEHQKWVRNVCHGNNVTLYYSNQLWSGICLEAKKAIEVVTSGLVV